MNEEEVRKHFVRQRKNLIIITLIVFFTEISGITVNKINILGNEAIVDNRNIIPLTLWVFLFYWLTRYYQYFRATGGGREIKEFYSHQIMTLVISIADKRRPKIPREGTPSPSQLTSTGGQIGKRSVWYWDIKYLIGRKLDPESSFLFPHFDVVRIGFLSLLISRMKALVHISLHTILIMEYVFPLILVFLLISYKIYHVVNF